MMVKNKELSNETFTLQKLYEIFYIYTIKIVYRNVFQVAIHTSNQNG